MKLAITGKGGVGKTTLAALLSQAAADRGSQVFAVDADPTPCLAAALGFPDDLRSQLRPIVEMSEEIEARTGAKPGTSGGFFTINPRVDDLPEKYSARHRGVRLLEMGAIAQGGSGCICPESALLKTLFTHMLFRPDEFLVMDMYAGVEHLGRATVDFVDAMLVVVEPTQRSLAAAAQIKGLAADIGLGRLWLIGNKVADDADLDFLRAGSPGIPLLGWLDSDPAVMDADRRGIPVYDHVPGLKAQAGALLSRLLAVEENAA